MRSPTNEKGLPVALRFDAFLWECWTQGASQSPEELAALKKMKRLEAQFNRRWGERAAARRRAVQELRARAPEEPLVSSCFFPPGPNVHGHVRGRLDRVREETGCVVNVPIDQEPIQVIGTRGAVERAKRLILKMSREALAGMDENPEFAAARSLFLTAQMTVRNLGVGRFDRLPSVLDLEAGGGEGGAKGRGDGDKGGEEAELARTAAEDQLLSAQGRLLDIVVSQAGGAQGDKVRQAFSEIFAWD